MSQSQAQKEDVHNSNDMKNHEDRRVYDLPAPYKICRLDHPPPPPEGQLRLTPDTSPVLANIGIDFRYQCNGPLYEEYMQLYQFPFVLQKAVTTIFPYGHNNGGDKEQPLSRPPNHHRIF